MTPQCYSDHYQNQLIHPYDLAWLRCFLEQWNGVELIQGPKLDSGVEFTSDAPGLWGCGASYGNKWFQYPWDAKAQPLHCPKLPVQANMMMGVTQGCPACS